MAKTVAEKLDYVDREFTTIDGRTLKMGDYFVPEDFAVSDKNEAFITYDALLRVTKRLLRIVRRTSMFEQAPNASYGNCAAVTVGYTVVPIDPETGKIYTEGENKAWWDKDFGWDSSADCSKENAPPGFERYPTTIAETRASGRCLRNLLNVAYCTKEEYGETTLDVANDKEPIRPGIITMIEKKFMGDYGIKIEQIRGLVKREFKVLGDLTSAEGADLVQKLHRNLEKLKKEAKA